MPHHLPCAVPLQSAAPIAPPNNPGHVTGFGMPQQQPYLRKPIRAIPHAQLDRLRVTVCAELRAREIAGSVILQSVVTAHSSRSS